MNIENDDKKNIPYYKIMKKVLRKVSDNKSDEVDLDYYEKTNKMGEYRETVLSAVNNLSSILDLSDSQTNSFRNYIMDGIESPEILELIRSRTLHAVPAEVLIETMSRMHDDWVRRNDSEYIDGEYNHKYLPFELVGWKDLKQELDISKAVMEEVGIKISRPLEYDYQRRVKTFFLNEDIKTTEDLENKILSGANFYDALKGKDQILSKFSDKTYVSDVIIPQLEIAGIGSVDDVRENILKQVKRNPTFEDLDMLTEEEQQKMYDSLNSDVKKLNEKIERQRIIQSIMEKAKELKRLKEQIAEFEKSKTTGAVVE